MQHCFSVLSIKIGISIVLWSTLGAVGGPAATNEDSVDFIDVNLKTAIEDELNCKNPKPSDMLKLTRLTYHYGKISDLSGIEYAKNLEHLSLRKNSISDLTPLTELTKLELLNLNNNTISDISPLSNLLKLERLELDDNEIIGISAISLLSNLSYLNIHENYITDLSPISSLVYLKTLLAHENQIGDISPLSAMNNLDYLNLHDNSISDISAISSMSQLNRLNLEENLISDISPLAGLSQLKYLALNENAIQNISGLASLANLETLYLHKNNIVDITPLSNLTGLVTLQLLDNNISDLDPLANLLLLDELALSCSDITDISTLYYLPNLTDLVLVDLHSELYCVPLYELLQEKPNINLTYSANRSPPTRVFASDREYQDKVLVRWEGACSGPGYDSYYKVFRALSIIGSRIPISPWQTSQEFSDSDTDADVEYYYWIRAATSINGSRSSGFSSYARGSRANSRPAAYNISISSSAGGAVQLPGEGYFAIPIGNTTLQATPTSNNLVFSHWTGSAVTSGKVANPYMATTTVRIDNDYTVHANFRSLKKRIYADNSISDPCDPVDEGSYEDGTDEHAFDRIQEAIEVATEGTTIVVRPGIYRESLNTYGKNLQIVGADPNDTTLASYPIISAHNETTPIFEFSNGEDPNCLVTGFVLTGIQQHKPTILLTHSSPTIAHCLIVGNQLIDLNSSVIHAVASQATFINCTVADNVAGPNGACFNLTESRISMSHCIIWNNMPMTVTRIDSSEIDLLNCNTLQTVSLMTENQYIDPFFFQHGYWEKYNDLNVAHDDSDRFWINGDYHLISQTGRWDGVVNLWIEDTESSPCIDAGAHEISVGYEPAPHGDILNLGAYGGTTQASKSNE